MAREGEGEALFKRGGALEFQEDRGRDNSLAPPPTELAKRQTLHSRLSPSPMVSESSIETGE